MTTITEGIHSAESLVSEASGERSREVVTFLTGNTTKACEVLGKVTASSKYVPFDQDASDGSEAAAGIAFAAVDASSADADGVAFVRDCEHNADIVIWPSDATAGEIATATAELAALGIILR